MAISKVVITSLSEMANFIEESSFFASVVYDDTAGSLACKDTDNNIIFVVQVNPNITNWTAYADASNYITEEMSGAASVSCTAYSTAKGLIFMNGTNGNGAACVISKTNNNEYCVLLPASDKYLVMTTARVASVPQKVIAWGDVAPFTPTVTAGFTLLNNAAPVENQTVLLPIATHNEYGKPSFFADAFFLPISQFRSECVMTIDGIKYVTDGFVCLRDE